MGLISGLLQACLIYKSIFSQTFDYVLIAVKISESVTAEWQL